MILPRVRFTVRRMMIVVAVAPVVMAIYLTPDALFGAFILSDLMLAFAGYLLARDRRPWSVRAVGISAVVVNIFNAILCVYHQDMMAVLGMALGAFFGVSMVLGFGMAWATAEARRGAVHRLSLILACLSVPARAGADNDAPHRMAPPAGFPRFPNLPWIGQSAQGN